MTTTPDVSPFKNDAEREAFWQEHLAKEKRLFDAACKALSPWREYLAETATDRQLWRLEKAVKLAIEAADFRAEHVGLPVDIRIDRGSKRREGRSISALLEVGSTGSRNYATGWVNIGVRGATSGSYWSGQLGMRREF